MQNRGLLKYKIHHVFFWLLVLGVWYSLRINHYSSPEKALVVTFIKVADLALMVYITNYVLIPELLYKKKYVWLAVAFVTTILFFSAIKMNILGRLLHNPDLYDWSHNINSRLYDNIIPHFILVIASAAIKLMLDYGELQQRMAETAKEKAEAELNFLKSQINPHFVFNSLNSVYFLIDKSNTAARETLHKFSDMLRYQLYEMNGDKIPIEKEIKYLQDYMDLQQLRKDDKYAVSFNAAAGVKGFSIEPLLLVPFLENAFKHLSHFNDKTNFVKVDLFYTNGEFTFFSENSKENQPTTETPGGIGLANVKRRLELLYPGKHELKIEESEDIFSVKLNLQLT